MQQCIASLLVMVLRLFSELNRASNCTLLESTPRHEQPPLPADYLVSGRRLQWPNDSMRVEYESNFSGCNVAASSVQVYGDRAFVALPRSKPGVPFSLGVVPLQRDNHQPNISAFPSWELNNLYDCNAIQSAVDIKIDVVGRLWLLDDGLTSGPWQHRCPPKLLCIDDVYTHVVTGFDLSPLLYAESQLSNLFVDFASDDHVFVYISDAPFRSIIVMDVFNQRGRRVVMSEFPTGPSQLVQSIALARKNYTGSYLYFTTSGSDKVLSVNVEHLRKENACVDAVEVGSVDHGVAFLGSNYLGAVFFNYKDTSDVYKWETETTFDPKNFYLVQKGNGSGIPTEVAPASNGNMWVLRSNFFEYNNNECSEQRITPL